ncbi:protein kinase domain-containing protein [Hyalangium gracile]|uniref:protein kinase domain-containing protein n=1 Tax=Hyalangium gracile TaxID=394092 RepID=UPI001CCCE9B8|nr:serine/threonine-protein kinase [Hyalangium gracile]
MSEEHEGANAPQGSNDTVLAKPGPSPAASAEGEGVFAGRYMLLGKIGRGGMGTVYRARDTLVGDVVALKMLELEAEQRADLLERFRREVRLARRISHPHVARTHDLGEHGGHLFLTMEYVEGEDLQSLLVRERALGAVRAARIALAVCEGLAAAHAAGVVHRDLKPANVLVEKGGRVVLTDFGIARAMAGESASRTQGMVGTPMYMSPEQLEGGEVEARSDLYAVGLLLYEMLTGEAPFTGDSPMAVAFARLRQPPPDPAGRPGVPDALAHLVRECLAREPSERPAGAHEVATVLRTWLGSMGEAVELTTHASTPIPGFQAPGPVTPSIPVSAQGAGALAGTPSPRQTPRTTSRSGMQGLAVLPLRFIGPKEQEYLGDGVTEGLIDILSRTRGVRVQSSGATARFRSERDPRVVGRELGVELMVDGTVQSLGKMVRVSLRLVEVASGVQLWNGRFEDSGEDAFALQDRLGRRMTEALRCELLIAAYRAHATPEVESLYRQALVQASSAPRVLPDDVLGPLEECIARAPGFLPAIGLHALATMRTWFMRSPEQQQTWLSVSMASMERANQQAPELVDTLLARSMRATQEGNWRGAVVALRAVLDAAPTCAGALQYLGSLQCEAGRADEGLQRLRTAFELDPTMSSAQYEIARCSALRGQMEEYREALEKLAAFPFLRLPSLLLRMRIAAWKRDLEEVQRCRIELRHEPNSLARNTELYASAVLGEVPVEETMVSFDMVLGGLVSPRFASMLCQLATEVLCLTDRPELALTYFQRAANTALIDLEWIDRCPALTAMRSLPGFNEGRLKVRTRVESIWSV